MPVRKPKSTKSKAAATTEANSTATVLNTSKVEAPAPASVAVEAPKVIDAKSKKPKLVRDSFTMPKDEYEGIDALKLRAALQGNLVKKSELLRAGLKLLSTLDDKQLLVALEAVPSIKTGRPAKTEEVSYSPNKVPAKSKKAAKAT
ncbi:hypothetical protein ACJJWD_13305 [Comamonas testosteroni]|uniref:hypothetical protein n=1 Tax=Comamonas testosteroni TaxID=285 RepID=UPI00389ACCFA